MRRRSLSASLSRQGSAAGSLDLGVILTGYLEKLSQGKLTGTASSKRRFVVLTHSSLRWYKREDSEDLFGEEAGCTPIANVSIVKKIDDKTFEVASIDRKRQFRTLDGLSCDEWVDAIKKAIKDKSIMTARAPAFSGSPPNPSFISTCGSEMDSPDVSLITIRSGVESSLKELVQAKNVAYNAAVYLGDIDAGHTVVIQLHDGAFAALDAATMAQKCGKEDFEVLLSTGDGELSLRLEPAKSATVWYKSVRALEMWGIALLALLQMSLLSLPLLGWAAFNLHLLYKRHQTSLGAMNLLVVDYIPKIQDEDDEASAKNKIPSRFVVGCMGDMIEARQRWNITYTWRQQYDVDTILERHHKNYDIIKKYWPHYYCGRGRDGSPFYYDRMGEFKVPAMQAEGIDIDDIIYHGIFITEFLYKHLFDDFENSRLIMVYDLKTANIGDLTATARDWLKKALGLLQLHYPERAKVIILCNIPTWFSLLWKVIRPLLNEVTVKKVRIAAKGKETFEALCEFADPSNIPVEYGGTLKINDDQDDCRWHSPEETKLREFVYELNRKYADDKTRYRVS